MYTIILIMYATFLEIHVHIYFGSLEDCTKSYIFSGYILVKITLDIDIRQHELGHVTHYKTISTV